MNELEKKEIDEIKQIFADNGFEDSNGGEEIDILAHDIISAGYGKVEDYKKEIKRLKGVIAMTEQRLGLVRPFEDEFDTAKKQAIKEAFEKLKNNTQCHKYIYTVVDLKDGYKARVDFNLKLFIDDVLRDYGINEE